MTIAVYQSAEEVYTNLDQLLRAVMADSGISHQAMTFVLVLMGLLVQPVQVGYVASGVSWYEH